MKNILSTLFAFFFFCTLTYAQPPQSEKEDRLDIKIHEDSKADVYIDGKKYDSAILNLLDSDKIATIDVLKGEKAIAKYNAPNGVIIVTSKKN